MLKNNLIKEKLLIFDYDGVIVDSIDVVKDILNNLHEVYSLPEFKTRDDVGKLFDQNLFTSLTNLGLSSEQSKNMLDIFKTKLIEQEDKLNLFPEIAETLRIISKNNLLAIISSNHSAVINNLLKKQTLEKSFTYIVGGEELGNKVEKINNLINKLDIVKKNVYYIGDTKSDIIEGKEAGVKTIAVTWGYHNKEKLEKVAPDFLFEQVRELRNFFSL